MKNNQKSVTQKLLVQLSGIEKKISSLLLLGIYSGKNIGIIGLPNSWEVCGKVLDNITKSCTFNPAQKDIKCFKYFFSAGNGGEILQQILPEIFIKNDIVFLHNFDEAPVHIKNEFLNTPHDPNKIFIATFFATAALQPIDYEVFKKFGIRMGATLEPKIAPVKFMDDQSSSYKFINPVVSDKTLRGALPIDLSRHYLKDAVLSNDTANYLNSFGRYLENRGRQDGNEISVTAAQWLNASEVIMASANVNGRDVELSDYLLLIYCIWNGSQNIYCVIDAICEFSFGEDLFFPQNKRIKNISSALAVLKQLTRDIALPATVSAPPAPTLNVDTNATEEINTMDQAINFSGHYMTDEGDFYIPVDDYLLLKKDVYIKCTIHSMSYGEFKLNGTYAITKVGPFSFSTVPKILRKAESTVLYLKTVTGKRYANDGASVVPSITIAPDVQKAAEEEKNEKQNVNIRKSADNVKIAIDSLLNNFDSVSSLIRKKILDVTDNNIFLTDEGEQFITRIIGQYKLTLSDMQKEIQTILKKIQ